MNRIKNFPISFFSVMMGLVGLTIALQKAVDILRINQVISVFFLYFSIAIFAIISIVYLFKILFYFDEVKREINHPVKINFLPTFSISLLLISIALLPISIVLSSYFWWVGMILHFIFSLGIISTWMHHDKFHINHMNPSWFIPTVGNILVPIAGVSHFNPELSWFFFSFGFLFWIILLVIFFYRIFFHDPLAEKMLPTLFILIAPPAVGFISYFKLTGEVNDFSKILYYSAVFFFFLLLSQITIFKKIKKFYLSWWAYSFPLAAISIATALMYHETRMIIYKYLFAFLIILLLSIIVLLSFRTIKAIKNIEICIEE
jgi:tellurite resistance protein